MKLSLNLFALLLACPGSAMAMQGLQSADPSAPKQRSAVTLPEIMNPTRLHYDAPGDGQLWVRAGTYKASFGAEGATYIPFLGSDAPQNYPVRMQLVAASLGGRELQLTDSATWSRDGNSITLERGEVDVRYHMNLEAMEQTFVLNSLPFDGDLSVRIAIDSELELSADEAGGFRFNGERGGVHYGSATVLDANGRSLAVESRLDQGAITITVPDEFLRSAALPVVVDPFLTTYIVSDTSAWTWAGDVAFDATYGLFMHAYTVNWSQLDSDVYSIMFDSSGVKQNLLSTWIDLTSASWAEPSVANNNAGNNFLVACRVGINDDRRVWARSRQLPLTSMGPQVQVDGHGKLCGLPTVGGNGNNDGGPGLTCVVWDEFVGGADRALRYRMFDSSGAVASPVRYITTVNHGSETAIHISKSNGRGEGIHRAWNVVWQNREVWGDSDIHGAQIGSAGFGVTAPFAIDTTPANDFNPKASAPLDSTPGGAPDYLVVYQSQVGSQSDIRASLVKRGTRLAYFDLTEMEDDKLGQNNQPHDQRNPSITTDGNQFIVTYSEGVEVGFDDRIYMSTFAHTATTLFLTETRERLSAPGDHHFLPSIASAAEAGLSGSRLLGLSWVRLNVGQGTGGYDTLGAICLSPGGWANIGTTTCDGSTNSTGSAATMRVFGYEVPAFNHVFLDVDNLPSWQWGMFLMSENQTNVPLGSGFLCLGAPQVRLTNTLNSSWIAGSVGVQLDLTTLPQGTTVQPGDDWYFQFWYRDNGTSNLSNAVHVGF